MTELNNKIFITSLNKKVNLSKVFGKLNLQLPYLLFTLDYYINFTEGKTIYNSLNKQLKIFVSKLKNKYPDELCNYKLQVTNKTIGTKKENTAPVVDDIIIDLDGSFIYQFTIEDFTNNFQDAQNDSWNNILIYPENLNGTLLFNNIVVNNIIELNSEEISQLRYVHNYNSISFLDVGNTIEFNFDTINDNFKFKISDNNVNSLYSSFVNINIINTAEQSNLPANIGDITKNVDNRVTTFLTLNTFTNLMYPPYSDPENDDIDAIRIDNIFNNNEGEFLYNDNPVTVGQIITANDLENNLFKHVGPNQDTVNTDIIEFSARDSGSLIWVQ